MSIILRIAVWGAGIWFLLFLWNHIIHPLAKFPGPRIASFTNLWKVYHIWRGDLEKVLLHRHEQHGDVVRVGPNHLDFNSSSAVTTILGSGRLFQKSAFYDAFNALRPNLFGTRDEDIHSTRRRAVAKSFSAQAVSKMEKYMDECMVKFVARLDRAAVHGEIIDIKLWISFFVMDVLGELAFARSFELLDAGPEGSMPPLKEHVLLATISGQVPWIIPHINQIAALLPFGPLRKMMTGRKVLRERAVDCVNARRYDCSQRPDLLGRLLGQLEAGHDSSGRCFDIVDVQTEAFGFIVAGSHTTAASTTLLLWHMLHHPETVRRVGEEIQSLTSVDGNAVYPFEALKRLKYLQAAISEGFRVNPVFIAPLMRVVPSHGHDIAGAFVPGGTEVSVCNHVVHHNGDIFGSDLHKFMPERWFDAEFSGAANLITFGAGHRACIGRNIAMAEISKLIATLLSRYDIESVDKDRLEQDIETLELTLLLR